MAIIGVDPSEVMLEPSARLAALAAAQVHQQNIDNPGRATNPDDEDLGDEELLNPRHTAEMAAPIQRRDRQSRFRHERRPVQPTFDYDDNDLDGAGAIGAIIHPPLAPGAKFNIISTMIQLFQLKGLFGGVAGDDPNMHLIKFISTCKSFDNPGIGQNAIRLRLFPLSLSGEATLWLNGLTPDSITNWRQVPTEALHETWERFKTKLMRCPNHHMTIVHLMEILYRSLNSITKPVVDNAARGSFMDLTVVQARNMLDRMTNQSRDYHTRDSEGGFRGNAQGNQGRNYYDKTGNKDRDQDSWKNKTNRSGLYVPPGRRDAAASSSENMSMEDMMTKLLKGVEATSTGVTESGKVLENPSKGKQVVDGVTYNDIDADGEDAIEAGKGDHDVTLSSL
ncbi:hypothetical protein CQW23_19512 [Capsicum baccatum]|uniref:Retrotransposon gag domain-containing protein n=1 Tax=Capsicum baccatum TaxID=33114 RepID=A0A2G2W609_CAPBA|nr:hypothetical protein CQW23_19512 [Capsicum baccatum]